MWSAGRWQASSDDAGLPEPARHTGPLVRALPPVQCAVAPIRCRPTNHLERAETCIYAVTARTFPQRANLHLANVLQRRRFATAARALKRCPNVRPHRTVPASHDSRTPADFNDGTGRDIYMNSDSRIPHTAKATFDERPQTQAARSKAAVRTAVLPPFSPSGTGRDTFHRIEYRDNRAASWSLRDYAPENTGIFTRAQFPDTRRNDRALRIERQCQQLAIHRLSTPKTSKAHSLATPGLIVAGSFLRT